jgi:DNA-binding PadR family transcriptional regulator
MLTRMLVLWLLSEGPLHGYRIRSILGDDTLGFWFPLEDASIYSCLRTLVKRGYARVLGKERAGRRPPRTRYAVTPQGRDHLRELLRRAWVELPATAEPVALALAATSELERGEVAELLAARESALRERLRALPAVRRRAPAGEMAERLAALTRAEIRWLKRMRREEK